MQTDYEYIELNETQSQLMALAKRASEESPDRSRKVGAVFVDDQNRILSIGFNTLPKGVPHEEAYLTRPGKYDWTEHAERNAIYDAAKRGISTENATVILPWFPCRECCRAIVQSGAKRLIAQFPDINDPQWGPGFVDGLKMLKYAGIEFLPYLTDEVMAQANPNETPVEKTIHDDSRPTLQELVNEWNDKVELMQLKSVSRSRNLR